MLEILLSEVEEAYDIIFMGSSKKTLCCQEGTNTGLDY